MSRANERPTVEQLVEILALFNAGHNRDEIAETLHVSVHYVRQAYKLLEINGKDPPKLPKIIPAEKICVECKLLKSSEEFLIGNKNGKSYDHPRCKECENKGARERYNNDEEVISARKLAEEKELAIECRVIRMFNDKITIRDIAKTVEISRGKVNRILRSNDLDANTYERKHPSKPPLTEKICCKCPEIGTQPIVNFRVQFTRKNGTPVYTYCYDCDNQMRNEYMAERKTRDPSIKIRQAMSTAIGRSLKNQGLSKDGESGYKHVGYTHQDVIQRMKDGFLFSENLLSNGEPWMTFANYGIYDQKTWDDNDPFTWRWQIDHIKPHSDFEFASVQDEAFKQCWALENLRPYSAKQNWLDGLSRIRHTK